MMNYCALALDTIPRFVSHHVNEKISFGLLIKPRPYNNLLTTGRSRLMYRRVINDEGRYGHVPYTRALARPVSTTQKYYPSFTVSVHYLSLNSFGVSVTNVLFYFLVFYWHEVGQHHGSNGLCFPLHMNEPDAVGWKYSAFLYIGVNGSW